MAIGISRRIRKLFKRDEEEILLNPLQTAGRARAATVFQLAEPSKVLLGYPPSLPATLIAGAIKGLEEYESECIEYVFYPIRRSSGVKMEYRIERLSRLTGDQMNGYYTLSLLRDLFEISAGVKDKDQSLPGNLIDSFE